MANSTIRDMKKQRTQLRYIAKDLEYLIGTVAKRAAKVSSKAHKLSTKASGLAGYRPRRKTAGKRTRKVTH